MATKHKATKTRPTTLHDLDRLLNVFHTFNQAQQDTFLEGMEWLAANPNACRTPADKAEFIQTWVAKMKRLDPDRWGTDEALWEIDAARLADA